MSHGSSHRWDLDEPLAARARGLASGLCRLLLCGGVPLALRRGLAVRLRVWRAKLADALLR